MKTLFIRNLSFETSEADLRKAFESFGKIHRCSIAKNRDTGESRGFGFVDVDDDVAPKAIADMNGKMILNRTIVVQESDPRPRADGAPSSGGARSGPSSGGGGPRPGGGMGGPRPGGAPSGPRPMHSSPNTNSGGARPGGPPMSRSASAPQSRTAQRPGQQPRPGMGGDHKNFGPDAAPASQRFKAYSDRPKDRLKPYKREHFDFRDSLTEEEENARKKARDDEEGGGGGE